MLYLVPSKDTGDVSPSKQTTELPAIFTKGVVFSVLTNSEEGDDEIKMKRRRTHLLQELRELSVQPTAIWRGFGFNLKGNWREDSFNVVFDADIASGRKEVVRLARKYGQSIMYEYSYKAPALDTPERMVRKLISLENSKYSVVSETEMCQGQKENVIHQPLAMAGYTSLLGSQF